MEKELLSAALESAFPLLEGWRQLKPVEIDGIGVDQVFYQPGNNTVLVIQMHDAYVVSSDLKLAQHLRTVYQEKMNGRKATVMLVYNGLLMRPARLPEGVKVMSVNIDGSSTYNTSVN